MVSDSILQLCQNKDVLSTLIIWNMIENHSDTHSNVSAHLSYLRNYTKMENDLKPKGKFLGITDIPKDDNPDVELAPVWNLNSKLLDVLSSTVL